MTRVKITGTQPPTPNPAPQHVSTSARQHVSTSARQHDSNACMNGIVASINGSIASVDSKIASGDGGSARIKSHQKRHPRVGEQQLRARSVNGGGDR
eukprot:2242130-Rhodomonas_salina.1